MESEVYQLFSEIQHTHWWFVARRLIIEDVLKRYLTPSPSLRIADIGCGTGAMLPTLARFGEVWGIDNSPEAVAACHRQNLPNVFQDDDPVWRQAQFDAMTFLDVIEHVEDDVALLKKYAGYLKPGGLVMITVPAFMFLWSEHDALNQHYRRYTAGRLHHAMAGAGLVPCKTTYFNTWLFPAIATARLVMRFAKSFANSSGRKKMRTDFERNISFLNGILKNVFASERFVLRHASFPFGVSLMGFARKPVASETSQDERQKTVSKSLIEASL
jgi:SAM-dependent methyltransferase